MNPWKRTTYLTLILAILALSLLACDTSFRTTTKTFGNSGEVRVRLTTAEGHKATSVEINEDWSWADIRVDATLSVDAGSCRATLEGDEGTQIVLDAKPGQPAQGAAVLVTDGFGSIHLDTDCQGGENMDLTISIQG